MWSRESFDPPITPAPRGWPVLLAVRLGGPLLVAACGLSLPSRAVLAADQAAPPSAIQVAIQHGLLTVDVREAPLADLLQMIGERAGLRVTIHGNVKTLVTD